MRDQHGPNPPSWPDNAPQRPVVAETESGHRALAVLGAVATMASTGPALAGTSLTGWPAALWLLVVLGWIPYLALSLSLITLARVRNSPRLRAFALGMLCSALAVYIPLVTTLSTDPHAPFGSS